MTPDGEEGSAAHEDAPPAPAAPLPLAADRRLAYLRAAAADALRYDVFPLLRQAEALAPERPRIGRSRLPAQNVADLTQAPALAFPASTLAGIAVKGDRAEVRGYYLGLTGPMGPLPLHLTEFAHYEERYGRTRAFGRFLDLVAGRMLQFFYRAWADSQPAAHADRPDDDRFARYIAALSGAGEGRDEAGGFDARARLHYAAFFAGRRSAGALEDALRHLIGAEVTVHPYEPRWRDIAREDRTRLGRGFATLGVDAVAGGRVRQVSDAFRVTVKARSLRDYETLLPSDARHRIVADALDAFAPTHLEWQLELAIDAAAIQPARLGGGAALGWTSWLAPRAASGKRTTGTRADARLRRSVRAPAHA